MYQKERTYTKRDVRTENSDQPAHTPSMTSLSL